MLGSSKSKCALMRVLDTKYSNKQQTTHKNTLKKQAKHSNTEKQKKTYVNTWYKARHLSALRRVC
jgi:hypothetical protein